MHPTSCRIDGWTPERQREFLEALAEGVTVEGACARAGMSVASAYAFRKRASGAAFALGWRAASLQARERLEGAMWSRAIEGYTESHTRADGAVVTRHKFDNRLAMAMLTRLDKLADDNDAGGAFGRAARFAAQDFDGFLDTLDFGSIGETAGWLGMHLRSDEPAELAAYSMLYAANRHVRDAERAAAAGDAFEGGDLQEAGALAAVGGSDADELCAADDAEDDGEDPALGKSQRQGWSAERWSREIAAGSACLPRPPECVWNPQLPQLAVEDDADDDAMSAHWSHRRPPPGQAQSRTTETPAPALPRRAVDLIWRCGRGIDALYFTCLPPDEDFDGLMFGRYGLPGFWRTCTLEEAACAAAREAAAVDQLRRHEARMRDAFLAGRDEWGQALAAEAEAAEAHPADWEDAGWC